MLPQQASPRSRLKPQPGDFSTQPSSIMLCIVIFGFHSLSLQCAFYVDKEHQNAVRKSIFTVFIL
jgi:hypothetical protein